MNPPVWLKLKIYIQHFFTGPVRLGWLFSCILNKLMILKNVWFLAFYQCWFHLNEYGRTVQCFANKQTALTSVQLISLMVCIRKMLNSIFPIKLNLMIIISKMNVSGQPVKMSKALTLSKIISEFKCTIWVVICNEGGNYTVRSFYK